MSLSDRLQHAIDGVPVPPKPEQVPEHDVEKIEVASRGMTVKEVLDKFLSRNLRIEKEGTRDAYRYVVKHLDSFLGRQSAVDDFTEETLFGFIAYRRKCEASVHTIDREVVRVLTLWGFAAKLGKCAFPLVQYKKHKPPVPVAWTRQEIRALFAATSRYKGAIKGLPGNLLMLAFISVIWWTAERMESVMLLRREDVDTKNRWITLRSRKGGGRDLVKRIPRSTAAHLRRLMDSHQCNLVFGTAAECTLYYHLNRILQSAGLPTDHKSKFHRIRRSHASHLDAAGGDATRSLDHESSLTTRQSYLDPRIARHEDVADWLFDPETETILGRVAGWFKRKGGAA